MWFNDNNIKKDGKISKEELLKCIIEPHGIKKFEKGSALEAGKSSVAK